MTDFLSRLVERVLGQAPAAQPLIAPQFAQGAEIFGPDATPFAVTETESSTSQAAPDDNQAPAKKREVAETYSTNQRELQESSEDATREVEFRQQPAKTRSTSTHRSDTLEPLTLSLRRDRETENSLTTVSPPVISPAIEQKAQQSSSESDSLQPEKEVRRKVVRRFEKEQTPVNRSIEKQVSPAPHTGSNFKQIEMTRERQEPLARTSVSVSAENVIPVTALPVEYGLSTERIVRPERITAGGRADSPSRATTADRRPSTQSAPAIKVTIGRIEVRAVLPPAPRAQETALPAPRMSLDDYLKSVSGERR